MNDQSVVSFSRRQILQLGCGAVAGTVAAGMLGDKITRAASASTADLRMQCPTDGGYLAAVDQIAPGLRSQPLFSLLLPATFVLTSLAYNPVRALAVTWRADSPVGQAQFTMYSYSRPNATRCVTASRAALRPGTAHILGPALSLRPLRRGACRSRDWSNLHLPERAQAFLSAAQHAIRMEVTIDDVLYADATLAGTATSGLQDRLGRQWNYERAYAAALLRSPVFKQTDRWHKESPFLGRLAAFRDAVGEQAFEKRLERLAARPDLISTTQRRLPLRSSWSLRSL